jgi:hypothetical protein
LGSDHPHCAATRLVERRNRPSGVSGRYRPCGLDADGIPAFFAAGKYGVGVISAMAIVFALSTIVTYVVLCVYSTAGLQRVNLSAFERYGEVLSGAFIVLVGVAFWLWPVV